MNRNRIVLDKMKLTPKHPPGRSSRKARAYAAEIRRLQALGYTFEAIREALAEVGVHVSKSTVQREAARLKTSGQGGKAAVASEAAPAPETPVLADARSGRDIAEAFVRERISNPLLRSRQPR